MLEKIGKLGELFGQNKSNHPLADAKEFRKVVAALPNDRPQKALDEITDWLGSVREADDLPPTRLYEIVCELDEAAQRHVFKLSRDYLRAPRLARAEEQKLFKAINGFWLEAAAAYERCLALSKEKDRAAASLRESLPLLCTRLIASLGQVVKSEIYRYGPLTNSLWLRLGIAYAAAEAAGVAKKSVQLYPRQPATTTPEHEYLRAAVLQTSSLDALLPAQIELAERLVDYYLPGFMMAPQSSKESVYWVDLGQPQPPVRLARMPKQVVSTLRYFHPARAHLQVAQLVSELERGGHPPADLKFASEVVVKYLLPVLSHLANCWAPLPPQRKHARYPVKHRMAVTAGLSNAIAAMAGQGDGAAVESWVVENVSRGGFGTVVAEPRAEWFKIGSLLGMQPEGGENWLLGVIRRYHRSSEKEAQVGIQTLSRQAVPVEMKPRRSAGYVAATTVQGLWLQDSGDEREMRFVLPLATFDLREPMEIWLEGRGRVLAPVTLVEQVGDYEIARYRLN
mgnify:CR=1 FL=1